MKRTESPFYALPRLRPEGVVAWLMVGLSIQLLTLGLSAWIQEGVILIIPVGMFLPSILFAWCAMALAGDAKFYSWMVVVQMVGSGLFSVAGCFLLGAGTRQTVAMGTTSLWIAFVMARPPKHNLGADEAARKNLPGT